MTTPSPSAGHDSDARIERALTEWDQGPYMKFLRPATEALVHAAGIRPGQSVLDVGTGYGDPALTIAAAVGPLGRVMAVDHDGRSLALAEKRAAARGLNTITFQEMDAQTLRFPDGTFDAVVSRLLIVSPQLFPSPVPILREMLRVLAPGGRVATITWAATERNPLFNVSFEVLGRYLPPPRPAPASPDSLDSRDPRSMREALARAGFVEVTGQRVPLSLDSTPDQAATYWEHRRAGSPASLQAMTRLTEAQQGAAEAEIVEAIRRLISERRATGEVICAAGVKPARG